MDYNNQKKYLQIRSYLLTLKDEDLISKIIEDSDHISIIFEKYQERFAKDLIYSNKDLDFQTIQDIITDSIFDLKDKILDLGADLLKTEEYSLEKYLFGICTNKIHSERKMHTNRYIKMNFENQNNDDDDDDDDDGNYASESNIPNQIQDNAQHNELIFRRGTIDKKTSSMNQTLEIMKAKGGKCHSLIILSSSQDYNYKISDLTRLFKYKNEITTRNQKYKCIQRFKRIYNQFQLV
jgi:hypothetical protein